MAGAVAFARTAGGQPVAYDDAVFVPDRGVTVLDRDDGTRRYRLNADGSGLALSVLGAGTRSATLANVPAIAALSPADPFFVAGTVTSYAVAGPVGAVASASYAVEARDERAARRTRRDEDDDDVVVNGK
jgi:hypothetical protein